jgi:hypothetical protein
VIGMWRSASVVLLLLALGYFASPKEFLELRGGHNEGIYVSGIDDYRDGLNRFFTKYIDQR